MTTVTDTLGKETSCVGSLRTGRYVTGARAVAEAAYRRIDTPRGTLRGGEAEKNYGIDLSENIGKQSTKATKAMLPGIIRNELEKDERIETVETEVVETTQGATVSYDLIISCTSSKGPFELKVAVNAVSTALLGITTEDGS